MTSGPAYALSLVAALLLAGCTDTEPQAVPTTENSDLLRLHEPRAVHRATTLLDGRVLITGGCTEPGCGGFDAGRTSEIYDPATGQLTTGPTMVVPRASNTATRLPDGMVLLAGGYPGEGEAPVAAAEMFDPGAEAFQPVAPLPSPRAEHTASLLAEGRVLVAGGVDADGNALATTEIFDPATSSWSPGPRMTRPRTAHAAVATRRGLLLVGGLSGGRATRTTELLTADGWQPGPRLAFARVKHAAVTLPDGRVLVVGGSDNVEGRTLLASTELIDLRASRVQPGPDLSEGQYKLDGAVVSLPDGRVVIAGGSVVDVYDPARNEIDALDAPAVPRRSFVTATPVEPDTVLVVGGYDDQIVPTADARLVSIPG